MALKFASLIAAAALAVPMGAQALVYQFNATVNSAQEVPTNSSPGNGVATLFYDDRDTALTTDDRYDFALSVFGLTGPATVYHIHRAPPGVNGPVIVGLDAAPFVSFSSGGTLLVGGSDVAPYSANFLTELRNNLTYVNVHTAAFPGGEIRGNLSLVSVVPEPASAALLLAGLAFGGLVARKRRSS